MLNSLFAGVQPQSTGPQVQPGGTLYEQFKSKTRPCHAEIGVSYSWQWVPSPLPTALVGDPCGFNHVKIKG
jgi:hypothetical protein